MGDLRALLRAVAVMVLLSLLGRGEVRAGFWDLQFFMRGDPTVDGKIDVSDASFLLEFLFLSGPGLDCEDSADANDDGQVDIADVLTILFYLFLGKDQDSLLPPPFTNCGPDETEDWLLCQKYPPCSTPSKETNTFGMEFVYLPPGQKEPNHWGLFDISDNATEWVLDWYAPSYPDGPVIDPTGPVQSTGDKVLRSTGGGGFYYLLGRSADRYHADVSINEGSSYEWGDGFRIVHDVFPSPYYP